MRRSSAWRTHKTHAFRHMGCDVEDFFGRERGITTGLACTCLLPVVATASAPLTTGNGASGEGMERYDVVYHNVKSRNDA